MRVSDAATAMYDELMRMKEAGSKVDTGFVRQHLNRGLITPVYFFDRLSKAGTELFNSLRRGYATFAQRMGQIEEFASETWTTKETADWKTKINEFSFDHDGQTVKIKLTDAQIMTLYMYTKRASAMQHIDNGGGVKAATIMDGKRQLVRQVRAAQLTRDDISEIVGKLSDKQREVCDITPCIPFFSR